MTNTRVISKMSEQAVYGIRLSPAINRLNNIVKAKRVFIERMEAEKSSIESNDGGWHRRLIQELIDTATAEILEIESVAGDLRRVRESV